MIRQELVARQLANHIDDQNPLKVLDVGCGQGSQAIRLARRGHYVVGVDPAPEMRDLFSKARQDETPEVGKRLQVREGFGEKVVDDFGPAAFDVVLCHGVIAYLSEVDPMLEALRTVLRPGGILSLLTVNGDALAMQPGMAGDWAQALEVIKTTDHVERSGVPLRAFSRADLLVQLRRHRLSEVDWYGLRVFSDRSPDSEPDRDLTELLLLEEYAGHRSPYRDVAAFIHTIARPRRPEDD